MNEIIDDLENRITHLAVCLIWQVTIISKGKLVDVIIISSDDAFSVSYSKDDDTKVDDDYKVSQFKGKKGRIKKVASEVKRVTKEFKRPKSKVRIIDCILGFVFKIGVIAYFGLILRWLGMCLADPSHKMALCLKSTFPFQLCGSPLLNGSLTLIRIQEAPPSPVYIPYVPELVYPEYIPPEDDVFPTKEQPLPAAATPTTDSPGYIPDSDPDEDLEDNDNEDLEEDPADYPADHDDEEEPSGDDVDEEDEEQD
nr:hypothetical protein [Tanacetum cinerariifolium]